MRRNSVIGLGLLALLAGLWCTPAPAQKPPLKKPLPTLEQLLASRGKEMAKKLQGLGYLNVGVLKFFVQKYGAKPSDNVGTLNLRLARRLEVALILGSDPKFPLGVIHNASAVAANVKGANHQTQGGQQLLFKQKYGLAWGDEKVDVDAFLTGLVQVSEDLKTLTLEVNYIDRRGKSAVLLPKTQAATTVAMLAEMGESFVRPPRANRPPKESAEQAQEAAFVAAGGARQKVEQFPLGKAAVVALDIYYDNQLAPVTYKNGKAIVPEPREGQKVKLVLRHLTDQARHAVVVKVNGENTIDRQHTSDFYCRKWVLEKDTKEIPIIGYQMSDQKAIEFRVLSVEESAEQAVNYGADVGMITVTVFEEYPPGGKPTEAPLPADKAEEAHQGRVIERAELPPEKIKSFEGLQKQILETTRGVLDGGNTVNVEVKRVGFDTDPTPVQCLTINYYKPKR